MFESLTCADVIHSTVGKEINRPARLMYPERQVTRSQSKSCLFFYPVAGVLEMASGTHSAWQKAALNVCSSGLAP